MYKPNDRLKKQSKTFSEKSPVIYMVVKGEQFPRPGLETYFVDSSGKAEKKSDSKYEYKAGAAAGSAKSYCDCNKVTICTCQSVCRCQSVCSCVGHRACSCVGHKSCSCVGHRSRSYGCRCAPVH